VPDATAVIVRTLTAPPQIDPGQIRVLPPELWSLPLTIGPNELPEALIQSPPGRYLWLRLDLVGNGQVTPLISAITIFAPRSSSLAYLPPVYHEDPVSADFLDRFLSYFDTVFAELEETVEGFTAYLDPDGAPPGDFLAWLAGWLDVEFFANWSDATRRDILRHAISLYKRRGTVGGLREMLRLHTGTSEPPVIVEHFRLRDYAARRETGEPDLVNGQPYLAGTPLETTPAGSLAHRFTVVVPNRVARSDEEIAALRRLIEIQKPAHTDYRLRVVRPGVRVGCQSTVGVDALIGPRPGGALGETKLAQGTVLAPTLPSGVEVSRSRLARTA